MGQRSLAVRNLLDRATLDRMHETAVRILSRTGIAIKHQAAREGVLRHEGFTLSDGRVLIAPNTLGAFVEHLREPYRTSEAADAPDPGGYLYGTSDRSAWIVDRDCRTVRPMTRADVIESAKLIHVLGPRGVRGRTGGVPTDVPLALRPMEQFMIAAEYCPGGGATSQVTDVPTAEVIAEMTRVYGREPQFGGTVWCPSPLILGGPDLDILWHFREKVTAVGVGSMPSMGITGPCDLIGVFTLAIAECLGGAAILHALFPGVPASIGPHPEPADMRTGAMVFGTPEWELLDLMHRDVYEHFGRPRQNKMLHTSAAVPNAQAQIERTAGALLGVLGGFTAFGPVGQLSLDEVWSPAQVILDLDIVGHADRIGAGPFSPPDLELDRLADVIDEVVRADALFAVHETTVSNFRRQYFQPEVLLRMARAQWAAAGSPDAALEAQRRAEDLTRQYDYEPPARILSELRAIYARAKERLGKSP